MRIRVTVEPDGKEEEVDVPDGGSGMDVLKAMDLHPDLYVVTRGDEILSEDEPLNDGDEIRLMGVVSGGGLNDPAGGTPTRARQANKTF